MFVDLYSQTSQTDVAKLHNTVEFYYFLNRSYHWSRGTSDNAGHIPLLEKCIPSYLYTFIFILNNTEPIVID